MASIRSAGARNADGHGVVGADGASGDRVCLGVADLRAAAVQRPAHSGGRDGGAGDDLAVVASPSPRHPPCAPGGP